MPNHAETQIVRVSIAVINFNGADTLRPTLQSVFALQYIRLAEVFLVDNHSEDDSLALVRRDFPGVRVIGLPENRGPNPARNEGLRCATADWVLIMDNDIVLANDYLNFALRQFGADARRAGCRCISILQTPRNKADAPKLRDRLLRRTSAFLQNAFITRWVKRKSGAKNNLHAVFIDKI